MRASYVVTLLYPHHTTGKKHVLTENPYKQHSVLTVRSFIVITITIRPNIFNFGINIKGIWGVLNYFYSNIGILSYFPFNRY